jgi:hypothetical protein
MVGDASAQSQASPMKSEIASLLRTLGADASPHHPSIQQNGLEIGTLDVPDGVQVSAGVALTNDERTTGQLVGQIQRSGDAEPVMLRFQRATVLRVVR